MNTVELLQQARDLIASPEAWTQGTYARNASGKRTPLAGPDAVCWCVSGALRRIIERAETDPIPDPLRDLWYETIPVVNRIANLDMYSTLPIWNDKKGRTHAEVIALLDAAIEAVS